MSLFDHLFLGLDATTDEVESARRRLLAAIHPDRCARDSAKPVSEERLQAVRARIEASADILRPPRRRAAYLELLRAGALPLPLSGPAVDYRAVLAAIRAHIRSKRRRRAPAADYHDVRVHPPAHVSFAAMAASHDDILLGRNCNQ